MYLDQAPMTTPMLLSLVEKALREEMVLSKDSDDPILVVKKDNYPGRIVVSTETGQVFKIDISKHVPNAPNHAY